MTPSADPFRSRLLRGDRLVGIAAYLVRTPEIVAVARGAGLDFVMVDTEHTGLSVSDVATMTLLAAETGFPALVRVGGADHPELARMLDCGAAGIVVPHVDSLAEAERVLRRCRFAPAGRRSIPGPQARLGFRSVPVREMTARIEADTSVILMIESAEGLAAAGAIAALEGVDALMIGANDLADGLGHPGDLVHPDVLAAFAAIAQACRDAAIAFGVIGVPEPLLASHADALGASLVVATNDVNLLMDGASALAGRLRASAARA